MYAKIRKTQWLLALSAALLAALLAATTAFAEVEQPPEAPQAPAGEPAAEAPADAQPAEAAPEPETAPSAPADEPPAETAPAEETPTEVAAPAAEETAPEPPAEVTAETEVPPAETAPAEETSAEAAVPVEAAPAEMTQPEAAALLQEAASEETAETLAGLAAETAESGVALADASGAALPLSESTTAELLAGGDPYYTVGLTEYNFYAGPFACGSDPYCFQNQGSDVIQDALDYMQYSGLPSDRKLYVQGSITAYGGFSINGFDDPWLALLGGVIGEDGSDNTFSSGDIFVQYTAGGFTLSGFSVNNGGSIVFRYNIGTLKLADIVVTNSDGYYNHALEVSNHAGAVVLEGTDISGNAENGAYINNTVGSYPITIKNSAFNHNGLTGGATPYYGLQLESRSSISIDGVSASDNNGDGIRIWNYGTLSLKNAFLEGNSSTTADRGYALNSYTTYNGTASLENVYAYGNDFGLTLSGGSLYAKYIEVGNSTEGHGLSFNSETGSSRIEYGLLHDNAVDGLHIENKGAITLNSVQSNNNGGEGAYLDNYGYSGSFLGSGAVTITSPASGGWQMANSFYSNGQDGMTIYSHGSVLISNVDMGSNKGYGLYVDNSWGIGSVTVNATLLNWENSFNDNSDDGISIDSRGTVKLSKTNTQWNGNLGINVDTTGSIELAGIYSANNGGSGAVLDNEDALLPRNVTLTNSFFDHNNYNGLEVYSNGSIIAYGLSASGNSIRNHYMGTVSQSITFHDLLGEDWVEDVYTFDANAGQGVNLFLKSYDFDAYLELYNPSGMLYLYADGGWFDTNPKISVASLPATGEWTVVVKSWANTGSGEYWFSLNDEFQGNIATYSRDGALLNNSHGSGAVLIYKPKDLNRMWGNTFNMNSNYGINIVSNGTILLDSATANENLYSGANLYNPDSSASASVTNSRTDDFYSEFNGNGGSGVSIATRGNVTLKNISAWGNNSNGAAVDTCQYDYVNNVCQGFGGVRVLALGDRSNAFGENKGNGLSIWSKGSIVLTNIYAEKNNYDGVWALNSDDGSSGSITMTTSGSYGWNTLFDNSNNGLNVSSNGSIILSRLDAYDNDYDGVHLYNANSPTSAGVLITYGSFNNNSQFGLEAYSKGAFSWRYGNASDNSWAGARMINNYGTAGISVVGSGSRRMNFTNNGWDGSAGNGGLQAYSNGKITLGYSSAEENNGDGFYLSNSGSITTPAVDVTEVEAQENKFSGLYVESRGAITVRGIRSGENKNYGAYLYNNNIGASGGVTVTTTLTWTENELWSNYYDGLSINTKGSVYLKNISAWANGWDGISVEAASGTGSVSFITTLRQFWLSNNTDYGLYINSNGSVNLINQYGLNAYDNYGDAGIYINNNGSLPTSTVSLSRISANENHSGFGIEINAMGNITASYLTAQGNGDDGVKLTSNNGGLTLSGSNLFTDNGKCGLLVDSAEGAISISNVRAWHNSYDGISVKFTNGNITLYNIISAHNSGSGLYLLSNGNFYLNKVTAFMNGQANDVGLYDDGLGISTGSLSTVTILNSTFMNNRNGSGIEIEHPMADDPITPFWPTLFNTSYLSNGETNLWVHVP